MDIVEQSIELWIGKQAVWIFGIVILLMFRKFIESAFAGFLVFFGNDYNADDIVYVNGKPGRIVRVGMWKTTFFIYDVKTDMYTGDAIISGGSKLVIQNSALSDMRIEKPLENVDLERYRKEPENIDRRRKVKTRKEDKK